MNKKAFSVAVASVAVAGTIAAPAMADETADRRSKEVSPTRCPER